MILGLGLLLLIKDADWLVLRLLQLENETAYPI